MEFRITIKKERDRRMKGKPWIYWDAEGILHVVPPVNGGPYNFRTGKYPNLTKGQLETITTILLCLL